MKHDENTETYRRSQIGPRRALERLPFGRACPVAIKYNRGADEQPRPRTAVRRNQVISNDRKWKEKKKKRLGVKEHLPGQRMSSKP